MDFLPPQQRHCVEEAKTTLKMIQTTGKLSTKSLIESKQPTFYTAFRMLVENNNQRATMKPNFVRELARSKASLIAQLSAEAQKSQ